MSYSPSEKDIMTFKRVEQMRRVDYAPAATLVNAYLREVKSRASKAYLESGGDMLKAQQAASDTRLVAQTLANIWVRTAPKFFRWTQEQIRKQSRKDISTDEWYDLITEYLLDVGAEHVQGINNTTVKAIAKVLVDGMQQGMSVQGIAAILKQQHPFLNYKRALLIARTEVIAASNWGSLRGAKAIGSNTVRKYWIRTLDKKTRDTHIAAGDRYTDENTLALDDVFEVGDDFLQYPGDPLGQPENICNCRCTLGYRSGLLDALQ